MADIGWVKIHRKIMLNPIYRNSCYVHLWLHLLLKANHKGDKIMWNGGILELKPGQFIGGRKKISLETGISESTVERALKYLENEQQIEQQTNNRFRVITIRNWKYYQDTKQQKDSKRTAKEQPADTNKNVKNVKKETIAPKVAPPFSFQEQVKILEDDKRRDLNIIALYFAERRPKFENQAQFNVALKRHLRAAKDLTPFTDEQILRGVAKAKAEYSEWTLETVVKMVTK